MSTQNAKRRVVIATATVGLVVALGGAWNTARANGGERRTVTFPTATAGLIAGEGLRTTITNHASRSVSVQVVVRDAGGAVVKQELLEVAPGQSRSVETSRTQAARSEQSVALRTTIVARRVDADDLDITTELIDWATGATRLKLDRKVKVEDQQTTVQYQLQQ